MNVQLDWLLQREQWADLSTVIMVESRITAGDKTSSVQRYFISSLSPDFKQIANSIHSYWAIENRLHRVPDVTLREDDSRVWKDHAPENMAMVRHIILNMLRNAKKFERKDMSLRRLQKRYGWR